MKFHPEKQNQKLTKSETKSNFLKISPRSIERNLFTAKNQTLLSYHTFRSRTTPGQQPHSASSRVLHRLTLNVISFQACVTETSFFSGWHYRCFAM